jgi:hypothetical protein
VPQRDASPEAAFWKEDHITEVAEGAAIVCSAFETMLALQPSRQAELHSQLRLLLPGALERRLYSSRASIAEISRNGASA